MNTCCVIGGLCTYVSMLIPHGTHHEVQTWTHVVMGGLCTGNTHTHNKYTFCCVCVCWGGWGCCLGDGVLCCVVGGGEVNW